MEPAPQHRLAVLGGADCGSCPLHGCHQGPVPPTLPAEGRIPFLVVAEAPGPLEVDEGATLIGPSGREVRGALDAAGMASDRASYTNAMLCRPPGGSLEDYLKECKRRGWKSPIECCQPRLNNELARADFTLFVGGASVKAAGIGTSVLKLRGTPLLINEQPRGLATLHPAFVLRESGRLMRPIFRFDVAKAVRLARGGNTWRDPAYQVVTTFEAMKSALVQLGDVVAVDTETERGDIPEGSTRKVDPWTARIRRVGLCDGKLNVIFAPLSVNYQWLIDQPEREACWELLRSFFGQPRQWLFHNFYAFDSIVLSQHGVHVNEQNLFDSLIGHHIGPTAEYLHGLDFLGSVYTDAPRWKDDVKHSDERSDRILDRYLSFDTQVTWVAGQNVRATVEACGQGDVYRTDAELARVGREMSRLGIHIDQEARIRFAVEYQAKANRLREEFLQAAGREVNPASPLQLRRLLYDVFGLPVLDDYRTDTGEPSTDEPTLLALLTLGVDKRVRTLIHALLGFREAEKTLGTFVGRLGADGRITGGPPVHPDGRLRTTWRVHGTTSGRWSSGDPVNLQNVPDKLRSMYVAEPGHVIAAADMSALELRILALLANDIPYIEAFRRFDEGTGPDIHVVNACTIFPGCTPEKVTKEVRVFAKRYVYATGYGAGEEKIFETLSLLRDDDLNPQFPGITLDEVRRVHKTYTRAHPAITAYFKRLIAGWRRDGFIATPWHGRKRYFCAGESPTEMQNHPIQGGAADMQNSATLALVDRWPFDHAKRTGLILQVHDQLALEVSAEDADRAKTAIVTSMAREIGPMKFPCEPKVGINWKAVS